MASHSCHGFRRELMDALEGRPRPQELVHLAWHEHLLDCFECRDLLEREEALELLLASLPEPNLPPDLTRRVLLRLEKYAELEAGCGGLDSLLDLDGALVPAGLSERVRAGIAGERALDRLLGKWDVADVPSGLSARIVQGARARSEADLDVLLDLNTVGSEPAGLTSEILRGLEEHRGQRLPRLRLLARMPRYAAAAAVLLAMLSAPLWLSGPGTQNERVAISDAPRLPGVDEVDPSLLAMLDMLENDALWSEGDAEGELALLDDDDDLHLMLEEEIDVEDEMLLSYLSEEDAAGLGGGR